MINAFGMICEAMLVSKAFGLSLRLTDLDAGHPKPLLPHQMVLAPLGSLGREPPAVPSNSFATRASSLRKGLWCCSTPTCASTAKETPGQTHLLDGKFCPSISRNVRPGKCASRLQQFSMLHAVNRSQGAPNWSRTR